MGTKRRPTRKKAVTHAPAEQSLSDLEEQLRGILEKPETAAQCLAFFEPLTETQRRKLGPFCLKWFGGIDPFIPVAPPDDYPSIARLRRNPLLKSAEIAVFWTASFSELAKLIHSVDPDDEDVVRVLSHRRPDWIGKYVERLLGTSHYWNEWQLVRALVKKKLCKKPDHPRYYTGMIHGLTQAHWRSESDVLTELKKDPELLRDEVWRLFEYEGDGENTLANVDRFHATGWAAALVTLSRESKLPRQRLLDAALDALQLGFNHYRSGWFLNFFDLMEPTPQEKQQRVAAFLDLVPSLVPNVSKWAFEKVEELRKQGSIKDTAKLVQAVVPLLAARPKATVKAALRMLADVAETSPELAREVALATTKALGHEKPDVQKPAFELLSRFGDASDQALRDAVEKYVPLVAASIRKAVDHWLKPEPGDRKRPAQLPESKPRTARKLNRSRLKGSDRRQVALLRLDVLLDSLASSATEIPAAVFDGTDIPRLDPQRRIGPIDDIEELIDVCARVLEDDALVDEGERAMDGLSRLCDRRPDDFEMLTGPLLKRATTLMQDRPPFCGLGVGADLCGLIHCWVNERKISIECKTLKNGRSDSEREQDVLDLIEAVRNADGHVPDEVREWAREYASKDASIDYPVLDGVELSAHFHHPERPLAFLSKRAANLSDRVAVRQARPFLSAPTHEGSWIDALELVRRINTLATEPDATDVVLAMLRLAPDHKSDALRQLNTASAGEWLDAIKYALGADGIEFGRSAALWVAAARSRSPFADDEDVARAFADLGPDGARAAQYTPHFWSETNRRNNYTQNYLDIVTAEPQPKQRDVDIPTQLLQIVKSDRAPLASEYRFVGLPSRYSDSATYGTSSGTLRWVATIWPIARESYFAMGSVSIGHNLKSWQANWHFRTFLEPLLDPDTPLREMGLFLLLNGLASPEPGEHGLATDAAIQAIADGRLGTDNLGAALARYLPTDHFILSRWAARFADIAQASELHGHIVLRAFEKALRGIPSALPRGLGDILEMMLETAARLGADIRDPECREFLQALSGSSKPAKAARNLLSLEPTGDSQVAIEQAIVNRTKRLDVWAQRR